MSNKGKEVNKYSFVNKNHKADFSINTHIVFSMIGLFMLLSATFVFSTGKADAAKRYKEGNLEYVIKNELATVNRALSETGNIEIPAEVNGYKVVAINDYAFYEEQHKVITIPSTVKKIGSYVFTDNDKLSEIKIPDSVTSLGAGAFSKCGKLQSVSLSKNVTKIQEKTFYECINLKSIKLGEKITNIGRYAFADCYKLGNVNLGKNIKAIGEGAFDNARKITKVTIPSGVKYIGRWAFNSCRSLKKATFLGGDTLVSSGLFQWCSELKSVKLPNGMTSIPDSMFSHTGLTSFKLPEKVTIIKANAFKGCEKLKSVKMNKKVYAIGDNAFSSSGLKSLKLNSNMQYIGNGAFKGTDIKSVKLPNKVTYIGNVVFGNCRKLNTISIPESVKGISPGAFNNCESLRAINVSGGNKNYSSMAGVLYNKNKTKLIQYPLNKRNSSFTVPGSVKKIRHLAFAKNSHLRNLTVNSGNIGYRAFSEMDKLTRVTLGSGVKKIGDHAFYYDSNLKTVKVADSITEIGNSAFLGTGITSFHIPSALKKFDESAFGSCKKLKAFDGKSKGYVTENGILYNKKKTELIIFPRKNKTVTFEVPKTVKRFSGDAISGSKNLKKIIFGKKIKVLPYACISNCPKLKSVVFARGTKLSSGYSAIHYCPHLAVIVGSNNYTFRSMASSAKATLITL